MTRKELGERWGRGAHGTTYGGNPVACAAGIAVLETIRDEDLVANARLRGAELSGGLRELMADHPSIGDVRGPGLMIGVEFVADRGTRSPDGGLADAVAARAAEAGLLILTCGAGAPGRALDPAARRDGARDRGSPADLRARPRGVARRAPGSRV